MNQQVYRITAATIAHALERKALSKLAEDVLEACTNVKTGNKPVLVRLDFPVEDGGMEIRCYRGSWLSWLFAGRALRMWKDES